MFLSPPVIPNPLAPFASGVRDLLFSSLDSLSRPIDLFAQP
jgi:hypothetical protein